MLVGTLNRLEPRGSEQIHENSLLSNQVKNITKLPMEINSKILNLFKHILILRNEDDTFQSFVGHSRHNILLFILESIFNEERLYILSLSTRLWHQYCEKLLQFVSMRVSNILTFKTIQLRETQWRCLCWFSVGGSDGGEIISVFLMLLEPSTSEI